MPRKFSTDFANRLGQAVVQFITDVVEFNNACYSLQGGMRAVEDQFRQIMGQCIQTSWTLKCISNGKIEEFERYIEYHKDLQAINELEQDIIVEEFSKFNRHAESIQRLVESVRRMERRQRALLKRCVTLEKINLTMKVIKELNTIADEEVSVQRIETDNASEILKRMRKCLGLPEESSSDTDEKRKERLEKLSLQFKELDELFGELETAKKEFLEL